ncbi:uncharacterized protein [Diadema setosum]|uniref:uncharacterized protein n=1 Tax=Diadema setosum TaxID=31175 RepID=UPI003B3AA186
MVLFKIDKRRVSVSSCLGCDVLKSYLVPDGEPDLLQASLFTDFWITTDGSTINFYYKQRQVPLFSFTPSSALTFVADGFGGVMGTKYHIKVNKGSTQRGSRRVLEYLNNGKKNVRITHSDQLINLMDVNGQLITEITWEGDQMEMRGSRGGAAISSTSDPKCLFRDPSILVWFDFGDDRIIVGTVGKTGRYPCLEVALLPNQVVESISFGQQHIPWELAVAAKQDSLLYQNSVTYLLRY